MGINPKSSVASFSNSCCYEHGVTRVSGLRETVCHLFKKVYPLCCEDEESISTLVDIPMDTPNTEKTENKTPIEEVESMRKISCNQGENGANTYNQGEGNGARG